MNSLVENFADISGHRDREVIDQSFAQLVHELVQPRQVAIHRRVGHGAQSRWLTAARLLDGREEYCPNLGEVKFENLPMQSSWPAHELCLTSGKPVDIKDPIYTTLLPLGAWRELAGVLEVTSLKPFTLEQRRILGSIGRFYRNLNTLLDENESDALTGLRNRKSFDETFVRLIYQPPMNTEEAADRRSALSADTRGWLAVIDIDHFKQVNDQHGHLIGDEVLLLLSRLMRECLRFDDYIYRFGGEEFVVLMRADSEEHVHNALERLRSQVESFHFPQVGQITVSIGFSRICEDDTPSDAFDRADQAVYLAKQSGRNRICAHGELHNDEQSQKAPTKGGIDYF